MAADMPLFTLRLIGPFRLNTPDGDRIILASKKSRALLAVLAMADDGERSRVWLQSLLWSSRPVEQASASLRRELSSLRAALGGESGAPITSCEGNIRLDRTRFEIDARRSGTDRPAGIFLEGIDLSDSDAFEDWLRDARCADRDVGAARMPAEARAGSSEAPGGSKAPRADPVPAPDDQGGPMLALLPFRAVPNAASQRLCADLLAERLVDHFLQHRWLGLHAVSRLMARTESDAASVARQVGADYCLSGTLRSPAGSLQAVLTDVRDDRILWSQHFAVPPGMASPLPPHLPAQLSNAVEARIDRAEQQRVRARQQRTGTTEDGSLMAFVLRGRWHLQLATNTDARIAEALFAEAVERYPDSAEALVQFARARAWSIWSERRDEAAILDLRRLAVRAIAADPEDSRGHLLCAVADSWRRQTAAALISLKRAIALAGGAFMPRAQLGSTLYLAGRPHEALAALELAIELSPNHPQLFWAMGQLAMTALMRDDLPAAVGHADSALAGRPGYWFAHVIKINAMVRAGAVAPARQALATLMTSKPSFKPAAIDWIPFVDPAWNNFLRHGLALAARGDDPPAAIPVRQPPLRIVAPSESVNRPRLPKLLRSGIDADHG